MERLSTPRVPIVWRVATVAEIVEETSHARTLLCDVPGWPGHVAGQHVDVRLTAEDGYQAQRSYSIASAPEEPRLALTVERIDDGEVSPYLCDDVLAGDELELRGPIGGPFTWRTGDGGPLLLVGGGSGLVPLMAMLRHRAATGAVAPAHLLVSSRGAEDLLYRDELARCAEAPGVEITYTFTRRAPEGWPGFTRRVDAEMLSAVAPPPAAAPLVYVCGPTPFVESVADSLVGLGYDAAAIRAERFGPTG